MRARRKARLRREIAIGEDRIIYKLSPDYDHDEIRNLAASLDAKRAELADLMNQEADPHV